MSRGEASGNTGSPPEEEIRRGRERKHDTASPWQAIARTVEASSARFVEAAVMTPVPPYGHRVPVLLGGGARGVARALWDAPGGDLRSGRSRQRRQDVPQHSRQRTGGVTFRVRAGRVPVRRGRKGFRLARRDLPGIDSYSFSNY